MRPSITESGPSARTTPLAFREIQRANRKKSKAGGLQEMPLLVDAEPAMSLMVAIQEVVSELLPYRDFPIIGRIIRRLTDGRQAFLDSYASYERVA